MRNTIAVVNKFRNVEFESSSSKTPQFNEFAKMFKKALQEQCDLAGANLHSVNVGHFYLSAFVEKNGKFVYISISDVRHFPNSWFTNVLIRTAKGDKDFSGGSNNYSDLQNLSVNISRLINIQN